MSKRIELKLYLALGTSECGEVKMIDYFFQHEDSFSGVTGSSFYFVSPEEIEERNDLDNVIDNYGYLWQEAVQDGQTTDSQEDYMQSWIDSYRANGEGLFICHDNSYLNELERDEDFLKYAQANFTDKKMIDFWDEEVGTFECVGGGRCFSGDEDSLDSYINDKRAALHDIARKFESKKISIEQVETFLIDNEIPYKKIEK